MSPEVIRALAVVAFVIGSAVLGLSMRVVESAMLEEVNRRLRETERLKDGWPTPPRVVRLYSAYRRLCPEGGLLRRQLVLFAVAGSLGAALFLMLFLQS